MEYMYYTRFIISVKKTAYSAPHSLHVKVDIKKAGNDRGTYAAKWTQNYIVAYELLGKYTTIDPGLYDFHTAFDVKPTKVVYNVDLVMNRKKILNITLDKNRSNSAATVKLVTDLETKLAPYTNNNVYRKVFE